MWNDTQMILSFLGGVVVTLLILGVLIQQGSKAEAANQKSAEEDRDRKDPANWWKYGGKPYDDED